jgi:ankyrin repeat protein
LEWERRLRPPERFGPSPLRAADAALLAAARESRWADALQLLKSGQANANARDAIGGHALELAARAGQDDLVRELIKRGAEIDRVGEDGYTALGAAAFAGRRSTVRLLVLAGAEVERWGATGQTALHLASLAGQMDVLEELLRLKADIEMLNRQRESALDVAATAGQQAVMAKLIEAGADALHAGER